MKSLKSLYFLLIVVLGVIAICSSCDQEENDDIAPSGNVKITYTKGAKRQSYYKYTVNIKYTGSKSDVSVIGVHWGKGNSTSQYSSTDNNSNTFSRNLDFQDGIKYSFCGFVKLKSGKTITSKTIHVTP